MKWLKSISISVITIGALFYLNALPVLWVGVFIGAVVGVAVFHRYINSCFEITKAARIKRSKDNVAQ